MNRKNRKFLIETTWVQFQENSFSKYDPSEVRKKKLANTWLSIPGHKVAESKKVLPQFHTFEISQTLQNGWIIFFVDCLVSCRILIVHFGWSNEQNGLLIPYDHNMYIYTYISWYFAWSYSRVKLHHFSLLHLLALLIYFQVACFWIARIKIFCLSFCLPRLLFQFFTYIFIFILFWVRSWVISSPLRDISF